MNHLNLEGFTLQEIKSNPVSADDLAQLYAHTKSYEALFNKRAILYKTQNLKDKNLTEEDYKNLLLQEYTFLKRPVFLVDHQLFIGNSKNVIDDLICVLNQ